MLDRRGILNLVLGICVVNGIFSPYLAIALQIAPILMPELFPRTVGWAFFFSSLMVSTGTLLLSGVAGALYERLIESTSTASMWIWFGAAVLLSMPALQNLSRIF